MKIKIKVQTNRIPTEGLKPLSCASRSSVGVGPNQQNPDRGIETFCSLVNVRHCFTGPNQQNPDRGIETINGNGNRAKIPISPNQQNPDRGIETTCKDSTRPHSQWSKPTESRPRD